MKKVWLILFMSCLLCVPGESHAQDITAIITAAIKKVVKAFDLQVQRLQTKTIWLQNAQKAIENEMQQLHLDEISDWVQKQKDLYQEYFDELWRVKTAITYYHRVKEIVNRQGQLIAAYKQAWGLLQKDTHFTPEELRHMQAVYTGLVEESLKSVDELSLVIQSFATQMSDQDRLRLIDHASASVDQSYGTLTRFNNQNMILSLQRARDAEDVDVVKKMYGLP